MQKYLPGVKSICICELKVIKSQKQFLDFSILPKNERKTWKHYPKSSQDNFFLCFVWVFWRIEFYFFEINGPLALLSRNVLQSLLTLSWQLFLGPQARQSSRSILSPEFQISFKFHNLTIVFQFINSLLKRRVPISTFPRLAINRNDSAWKVSKQVYIMNEVEKIVT